MIRYQSKGILRDSGITANIPKQRAADSLSLPTSATGSDTDPQKDTPILWMDEILQHLRNHIHFAPFRNPAPPARKKF